ncbi:MAG: hypothetical protein WKF75_16000 [Singulisphaera sp.]
MRRSPTWGRYQCGDRQGRPARAWRGVRLTSRTGCPACIARSTSARAHGTGRAAITAAFEPTAQAGPDGVARFGNIYPGLYQVAASESPAPNALGGLGELGGQPFPGQEQDRPAPAYALAEGWPSSPAASCRTPWRSTRSRTCWRLRAVAPDGRSPLNRDLSFQFGRRETGASATFETDDKGIGRYDFGSPGLWAVDVRFGDAEARGAP